MVNYARIVTDNLDQFIDLAIAAGTNIGAIYLTVVFLSWTFRLRHSRTNLRALIGALVLSNACLWFWSASNGLAIVVNDVNPPWATLPARLAWLVATVVHVWVTTRVRPAPILPDALETELDKDPRLVLIVEDNEALARLYRRFLEQMGINAEFATSARGALLVLEIEMPRLIVMDLGLPDMDGVSCAHAARTLGYAGPIIALSGAAALVDLAKATGFAELASKPIGAMEFVALVRRHL